MNTEKTLHLSHLLQEKYATPSQELECTLELSLQQSQKLTIVDDSEKYAWDSLNISITVPQDAHLEYRGALVDTTRSTLAGNPISSNINATIEKQKKSLSIAFTGKGAHADVKCTYLAGTHRSYRLKTLQNHLAPDTTSNLHVNGVFEGDAQFFCDNLIQIHKDAQRVDAEQCNKNLLLSPSARAVTIPKMEVEAHDVACRHGAATSKIGADELFYLQSRGLGQQEAEEMLIQAFLS